MVINFAIDISKMGSPQGPKKIDSPYLKIFKSYLNVEEHDNLYRAAAFILSKNIVYGDALTMCDVNGNPIIFAEWGYLGKGKFQRRDFRFDVLTDTSSFSAKDSLFANLGMHEIFQPIKTYDPMTIDELASQYNKQMKNIL